MKPETNLFLRSLIGKEKARLCAEKTRIVSNNCAQSPASLRLSPEDVDKIIQIDRDAKALNSALSELREEAEKQDHLGKKAPFIVRDDFPIPPSESTPHFSPEIIEEMRSALRNNVRASDSAVKLMQRIADGCAISPGWLQSLSNLQKRRDIARLAAKVFDAAYPEEPHK